MSTLSKHMLKHNVLHTGPTFYNCEVCSKSYNVKRTLEDHIKHLHMGVPYQKRIRIEQKRSNDEINIIPKPPDVKQSRSPWMAETSYTRKSHWLLCAGFASY